MDLRGSGSSHDWLTAREGQQRKLSTNHICLKVPIHVLLYSIHDNAYEPRVVCCPINREVLQPEQNAYMEDVSKCWCRAFCLRHIAMVRSVAHNMHALCTASY